MSAILNNFEPVKAPVMTMPDTKEARNSDYLCTNPEVKNPLKIFGLAKKSINQLFGEIADHLENSHIFLRKFVGENGKILEENDLEEIIRAKHNIESIKEALGRDHMKVVFFGRTSNGKSTVINALLGNKILPSGIGHTTNCFIQVEGTDDDEPHILTEDSTEKKSIQSVLQLANALENGDWGDNTLIRVLWPNHKCSLLKHDVVLVDSPGIDVTLNMDEWIDRHCMDADMFVLVSNAESTLMKTEKSFFHRVSEKISKPNIFILHNRWDASAKEPETMEKVRKQHTERAANFLEDELNLFEKGKAANRIYFVSAEETLRARTKTDEDGTERNIKGFQIRNLEFKEFEEIFQESLCHSAVKTRFEKHIQRAQNIVEQNQPFMEQIHAKSTERILKLQKINKSTEDRLSFLSDQHKQLNTDVKTVMKSLREHSERQVFHAMQEEIKLLSVHINKFNQQFDSQKLDAYKEELFAFLDTLVVNSLHDKFSGNVEKKVTESITELTGKVKRLLPTEHHNSLTAVMPPHKFKLLFQPDFKSLCSDFEENLEFRFTLSLSGMLEKIIGFVFSKYASKPAKDTLVPNTPQTPSNEVRTIAPPEDYLTIVRSLALNPTSSNLMGAFTMGAFLVKGVGIRVIGFGLAVYGGYYLYERMSWNNYAKETAFKKQFLSHATNKMKLVVDLNSTDCSHQIQQELTGIYSRYSNVLESSYNEIKEHLVQSMAAANALECLTQDVKKLKNQANFLTTEINRFNTKFLPMRTTEI